MKGNHMAQLPPLDRWRFDAIAAGPEKIWGMTAIAHALGVSTDKARRIAKNPAVPIYRNEGGWFALRSELNAWLKRKGTIR
jgi:hypothetical protein